LPCGLQNSKIVAIVLDAQDKLYKMPRVRIETEKRLNSGECEEILKAAFWATFLEMRQPELSSIWSAKLVKIIAENVSILMVRDTEEKIKSLMHDLNKTDFFILYNDLLPQLLYVAFCNSFPQSHEKFDCEFRDLLVQKCSEWFCGVARKPFVADSWILSKLEPKGFRKKRTNLEDMDKNAQILKRAKKRMTKANPTLGPNESAGERNRSFAALLLVRRYRRRKKLDKIDSGRSSGLTPASSARQDEPAQMRELPREFKFHKSEFNIYGLSQLVKGSDLTEKQSTWISRTEIDPHFDMSDSFSSILASSKKSTERIASDLREGFGKQRKLFVDLEKSRNLESQIMDAKIKAVISSKSKVHAITTECLKNSPKMASSGEILAILQKQKFLE